jgi:hypothetical protein
MNQILNILNSDLLQNIGKEGKDLGLIFLVSVPLSVLLYIVFSKHRHWLVVDLGHHTWLVK